jgi:mono/diheme cytochrome c family protein
VDCHGEKGDGNGVLGKTMTPPPANYQNCDVLGALSDQDIRTVILKGSAAVGRSNAMQGFDKKIKDPALIDQLITVVRSFGGCGFRAATKK